MDSPMEQKKDFIEVDELDIGLDRSGVTLEGEMRLPDCEVRNECEDALQRQDRDEDDSTEPKSPTRRVVDSIRERKHDAASKIKKMFHVNGASDEPRETESSILAYTSEHKSQSRLTPEEPVESKEAIKDFVHHPYDTVKAKVSNQGNQQVAAHAGVKQIPHGQEVDLVKASIRVQTAATERERLLAIQNLSELLKERQNTYVRWTLDRHVTKIRILPREDMTRKSWSAFKRQDHDGESRVDWRAYALHLLEYNAHWYGGQYIGYGSDPPIPSQQALMPNMERLIVVTSPFQEFLVAVRRIYRWYRPRETVKYLVIYISLWYTNLLLSGVLCVILYLVTKQRFRKKSLESLREDVKRREDAKTAALSLTDFVDKYGEKDWADEMLQGLVPWLIIQLGDVANFFESVQNFYEWRTPSRTILLLCLISVAIFITAFTPTWLLVKASTLFAGIVFFGLFPIASHFPEYRLLVSPSKRLLWNIPTHAEWAIKYIQAEGTRFKSRTASSQSPQSSYCSSYKAYHEKVPGHLFVTVDSIRFESSIGHSIHLRLPYEQIGRLEKHDCILRKHLPTRLAADVREDLKIVTRAKEEWILKGMEKRNEAFAQIVGFSQNHWQVVW